MLTCHYFRDGKLPRWFERWQAAFGHIYADVQSHALLRGMVHALAKHGAGSLIHRGCIEWCAQCVDQQLPKHFGASQGSDMAIWFWANGSALTEKEKQIALETFHKPLSKFPKGEDRYWGTQNAMYLRTSKSDGSVVREEDIRLQRGLRLWNALKKAGATGKSHESAKL